MTITASLVTKTPIYMSEQMRGRHGKKRKQWDAIITKRLSFSQELLGSGREGRRPSGSPGGPTSPNSESVLAWQPQHLANCRSGFDYITNITQDVHLRNRQHSFGGSRLRSPQSPETRLRGKTGCRASLGDAGASAGAQAGSAGVGAGSTASASASASAGGSSGVSGGGATIFDQIFNIPISVLKAVNQHVNNKEVVPGAHMAHRRLRKCRRHGICPDEGVSVQGSAGGPGAQAGAHASAGAGIGKDEKLRQCFRYPDIGTDVRQSTSQRHSSFRRLIHNGLETRSRRTVTVKDFSH
ncbi:hypothetical protein GE061_006602 [Apolygus lucorum]|uniref:Uncharacterized protein n=1 Tax=Apolygus lucorum TaxID=248454 RepID=A0A8S9WVP3_APOLU|nr:hypothetical protein GE061_006602 [Apolygus lucorum]